MVFFAFLVIGIFALLWVLSFHRNEQKIKTQIPFLKEAILAWDKIFNSNNFIRHSTITNWKSRYITTNLSLPKNLIFTSFNSDEKSVLKRFSELINNKSSIRKTHNREVVKLDMEKYTHYLRSTTKVKLDSQQLDAIFNDEDNNLVVAGAGTGKTSTLMGKIAFILQKKLATPNEILCIAFTKNAAIEMSNRLVHHISNSEDIQVKTFHSFGYEIIGKVEGAKPALSFENNKETESFFARELKEIFKSKSLQKKALRFFSYHLTHEKKEENYNSLSDYYKAIKSSGLLTMKGQYVKSYQELEISNFFFINGINYEYEKQYPIESERDPDRKVYQPDFYLIDYGIYLEHFGIDRNGNVPKSWDAIGKLTAKEHYQKGIEWKRDCHERNNTTLIESYSYEFKEGIIFQNLEANLRKLNVKYHPISADNLFQFFDERGEISLFIKLIITFLSLFKSNNSSLEDLKKENSNTRSRLFLKLFEELKNAYDKKLSSTRSIDFNDMIGRATSYVVEQEYKSQYRYVLVDEFQDLSVNRYNLLNAVVKQNNAVLFGVGDDWQSIFRFSGSDISLMTKFKKYFGFTFQSNIETTFRFGQNLVDLSSDFVTANPNQLTKDIVSHQEDIENPIEVSFAKDSYDIIRKKLSFIQTERPNSSVFLLGRYNHDKPKGFDQLLATFPSLTIQWYTVHGAKGLTCDYSILINVISGKHGFPAEMADDPLLLMVMSKVDTFINSEERRVFYVALTRARYRVFILSDPLKKSLFVSEIENTLQIIEGVDNQQCPRCEGQLMERVGKYGKFLGCQHYPLCKYSINVEA